MNDPDNPFEDAVREGLGAWADDVEVPQGLGSGGIRRARRRAARRAAMVGVPVVAAAAVVVVVVSGGGAAGPTLTTHPPSVPVLNASAVVRKVSARVKALGPSDGVLETVARNNQQRKPEETSWTYTKPHGDQYDHEKNYNKRGTYVYGYWNRSSRLSGNRTYNIAFEIEPLQKSYGIQKGPNRVRFSSLPGIQDTAQQIAQTLTKGHVHLAGQTTIQGQKALRLSLPQSRGTGSLYVNADTYRPIEQVEVYRYHHGRLVYTDHIYLRPATPANIAKAVDRPDLKGYRRR